MCLIALAYRVHPDWPLLLVANRDEFHARNAAPLAWWADAPEVLAGRDLAAGGTWLGVSRGGRMAAITNVRGADAAQRHARSRGALVRAFLQDHDDAGAHAATLRADADLVGGYNLLLFDGHALHYATNRPGFDARAVEPGVHALSNAQLDTPWPKALAARQALIDWLDRDLADEAQLLDAMRNRTQAHDAVLPRTGVSVEMERVLSSAFIATGAYGTRCTSLLRVHREGHIELFECRYDRHGAIAGHAREHFTRQP